MKIFFQFTSTLNRNLSSTRILLEIILVLGINAVISMGMYYKPYISCLYIEDNLLTCSEFFGISHLVYIYDESKCFQSCDESFRSTFREDSINLSGRGINNFDSYALRCMKCMKELDLSKNVLDLKSGNYFNDLSELKRLKLSYNNIKSLTKITFQYLVSLEELFLDFNQIQSLPVGVFDKLVRLQVLNLQGNQLGGLSYQVMSPLIRLVHLNLKSNKLRTLANTFMKNEKLEVLDLSNNSYITLESDTFGGLKNLKELFINDCGITSFPIPLFQNIRCLRDLHIDNNHFKEISAETFAGLESLSGLYAASNKISLLKNKPFLQYRNLTVIDLTGNNLVYINKFDLEGLRSLKVLKLSSNFIEYIFQGSFKDMPLLETLVLKNNKIKTLFSFENNTQLKFIDISHNQLTDFRFMELQGLLLLKEFRVTDNYIQNLSIPLLMSPSIPSTIPELHFNRNKIERIMFMNTNKSLNSYSWNFSVYLEGNPLLCDCHMYNLYRYLKDNTLSQVKFADSVKCHSPFLFKNLHIQNLNSNDFLCNIEASCPQNCKCVYRAFDRSRIANCTQNNYTNLPLAMPPGIHILYIGQNSLTSLTNLNQSCWENLTEIHVEGNEISYEEFAMPRNLKFLGLRDNKIDALPEVIIKHAETFKDFKMSLSNNVWRCDCWLIHLKVFLSKYGNQVVDKDNIKCTFGNGTDSFLNLISMTNSDICPDIHSYIFIIGFVLLILCVFILRRRYKHQIAEIWNSQCPPHIWNPFCVKLRRRDHSKLFDCFLSYCLEDKSVAMAIVREMNKKALRYIFCTHERNWTVDCQVTNNVSFTIQSSRSALVVFSEAFSKNEWFQMEFRWAFEQLRKDKKFKLILVIIGDIPDKSDLQANVQFFLCSGMYLKFEDKWFWHKLQEAFRSLDMDLKLYIPEDT